MLALTLRDRDVQSIIEDIQQIMNSKSWYCQQVFTVTYGGSIKTQES